MAEQDVVATAETQTNPAWTYERSSVPTLFGPWTVHAIEAAAPRQGERVLDVGCGTGIVARRIAPHVMPAGKVAGIDPNPNMLAVAREAACPSRTAVSTL
jgi:ubiquinone/menaquinone biosynthesis C-methylase UbiE